MDNQKIVVVLLLITIILSVVSVVVTFSASPTVAQSKEVDTTPVGSSGDSGKIGFEIVNPPTGGTG